MTHITCMTSLCSRCCHAPCSTGEEVKCFPDHTAHRIGGSELGFLSLPQTAHCGGHSSANAKKVADAGGCPAVDLPLLLHSQNPVFVLQPQAQAWGPSNPGVKPSQAPHPPSPEIVLGVSMWPRLGHQDMRGNLLVEGVLLRNIFFSASPCHLLLDLKAVV